MQLRALLVAGGLIASAVAGPIPQGIAFYRLMPIYLTGN
jgi:hypothetical protein